jgi:hypothetical protein
MIDTGSYIECKGIFKYMLIVHKKVQNIMKNCDKVLKIKLNWRQWQIWSTIQNIEERHGVNENKKEWNIGKSWQRKYSKVKQI